MQTRRDAVLKKIVMDRKLRVKTRRTALADMEAPSRAFLTRLANDPDTPDHVRLDATRRLPEVEHRMAGGRVARAQQRIAPDEEARRQEIDRILAGAAEELGINLDEEGGSKTIPESVEQEALGSLAALPNVPPDEISSEAGSRSQSVQPEIRLTDSSEPPAQQSDSKREELLASGRALAASVLVQYERFTRCPHNLQESKRLDYLQGQFLIWERQAHIQHADIDTQKEFPDPRLRPPPPKVMDARMYQAHRQVLAIDEQAFIAPPRQTKATHADSGMWGGTLGI